MSEQASPPVVMPSVYGPPPRQIRAADLAGMEAVGVDRLFPDLNQGHLQGRGVDDVAAATRKALEKVDMGMIKPDDTVNILCSEHGFYVLEGLHYLEMLKVIGETVLEKTGCRKLRYCMAAGVTIKEVDEIIRYFDLKKQLPAKVRPLNPWDKAVAIETEIGTLYGLAGAYDADWIIHASHDEPRDLYFYRMMDRNLKAFAMSYARYETRAVYHGNFFGRSANFLQRAIFDSQLVQDRFSFACILRSSPAGIIGVDADNDLRGLDKAITKDLLKDYGKMLQLLSEMEECITVLDAGRLMYYLHAGGICFGCLEHAAYDPFDLSNPAAFASHDISHKIATGQMDKLNDVNIVHPSIKAVIINQAWPGLPIPEIPILVPTIVVGRDMADLLASDPANPKFMHYATTAETLEGAIGFAKMITGTDKIIAFDGSFGHVTCSNSMAEFLLSKAPAVNKRVEEELLPMWLNQRGM